jgi:4a-hydroxytetrahydrobiopterin dehydratase
MNASTQLDLASKKCVPCEGGVTALSPEQIQFYLKGMTDWTLTADGKRIRRVWRAFDFMVAIDFFQRIARLAEEEDHHPDLHLTGYRNVVIEIGTHAIDGLSENDFILAAKINELPVKLKN